MTDITELAQSLKAAADREMICRDVAETSEIWERTVTPENILALVEALEKAQAQSSKWLEAYHKAVSIGARYEERIAELESRTVKLPKPISVLHRREFTAAHCAIYAYPEAEVNAALDGAGIKWEAE